MVFIIIDFFIIFEINYLLTLLIIIILVFERLMFLVLILILISLSRMDFIYLKGL